MCYLGMVLTHTVGKWNISCHISKQGCHSHQLFQPSTSCKELTHWKRLWCWEGLGEGREGDVREWDGWMASLAQWTWVWVNSGSWWWTGRPGVLCFMASQGVRHDWTTELNWTELNWSYSPGVRMKQLLPEASREQFYSKIHLLLLFP